MKRYTSIMFYNENIYSVHRKNVVTSCTIVTDTDGENRLVGVDAF